MPRLEPPCANKSIFINRSAKARSLIPSRTGLVIRTYMRVGITRARALVLISPILFLYTCTSALLFAGNSSSTKRSESTAHRVSWHKVIIRFLPTDLLALPICEAARAVCCERGEPATKRIAASRVMEVVSSTYLWFCLFAGFLATALTSRWDRRGRTSG